MTSLRAVLIVYFFQRKFLYTFVYNIADFMEWQYIMCSRMQRNQISKVYMYISLSLSLSAWISDSIIACFFQNNYQNIQNYTKRSKLK